MNCTSARQQIEQGQLDLDCSAELAGHLRQCELCYQAYSDALVDQRLRALPVPRPDRDFANRVVRRAGGRRSLFAATPMAVAALLVMGIGLGLLLQQPGTIEQPAPADAQIAHFDGTVYLVPDTPKEVRLAINSATAREDAVITLEFGDGLEVEGYSGRQQISWTANLAQGENLIRLPLRLDVDAETFFQLSYSHGEFERRMRVAVKPERPDLNQPLI